MVLGKYMRKGRRAKDEGRGVRGEGLRTVRVCLQASGECAKVKGRCALGTALGEPATPPLRSGTELLQRDNDHGSARSTEAVAERSRGPFYGNWGLGTGQGYGRCFLFGNGFANPTISIVGADDLI